MMELIGCMVACSLLVIGFKIFDRLKISSLQAIVINYISAAAMGMFFISNVTEIVHHTSQPWFIGGCLIGAIFMFNFILLSFSVRKIGASITTVASKMSLVLTVLAGILLLGESAGILKIIAVVVALVSVFLITRMKTEHVDKRFLFLPLALFLGGACIDIGLNYNQAKFLQEGQSGLFTMLTFFAAFLTGLIILVVQLIRRKEKLNFKSILGGILLGVINWFSIYFLLGALKAPGMESSTVYTILNVGILLLTVFVGVLVFKEKLNTKQWIGVVLAIAAIVLISFSGYA